MTAAALRERWAAGRPAFGVWSLLPGAVTAELLRTIGGSTFDLGPIFDEVLRNAVTLCRAHGGHIWRFDGTQ